MVILGVRLRPARETRMARAAVFVGVICAGALAVPLAGVADASVIVVTSTADSGAGTLRDALATASPGDTISIPVPGDYLATSAELAVTKDVSIQGVGSAVRIVGDGNNRVFNVTAGNATLAGLTVTGGGLVGAVVAGGGIANAAGTLVLSGVTVKGNSVSNGTGGIPQGGGVSNAGTLQIVDSMISGNSASIGSGGGGLPEGGGVANTGGSVSIIRSTISDNTASIGGSGGAPEGGGILSSGGQLTILDSTVRGNTATGGAVALGGGIAAFNTTTTLTRTTVSANAASEASGPVSDGGGMLQFKGSLSLVSSTIAANTSAGSEASEGGGVDAEETTVVTTNSTIAGNVASGAKGFGGNLLSSRESTVKLQNTIVARGTAVTGANCGVESKSVIQSLGHNLDSLNDCGFAAGDIVNADPLLGPLTENGGVTQTMALAPSSPAIDAAAITACPPTDQRGVLRPAGAGCDIGAFELATPLATSGQASAIGLTAATLNGLGSNPDLAGASAVFQYGTTAAYGSDVPTQAIGPTTQAAIASLIGGLTPATVYHFRLVVQNGVSTSYGADHTFTTTSRSVAPVLSGLAVQSSNVLPELGKGASTARRRGARISYSDSAQATTTLTVSRVSTGFRVGRRCQAKRPSLHKGKLRRCTLYVTVGSFTHADVSGANRFHFTGRVNGAPLRVGSYRLQARARNSIGQTSRPVTTAFRVIR